MKFMESLLLLGLALSGALLAHALLSRVLKAMWWAWSPLAVGEAEAFAYQRTVYRTADPALLPIVGLAAGAGLAWGVGLVWSSVLLPWLMVAGVLGVLAAVALDLRRWERVAVSGQHVWVQRGLGQSVRQVPIDSLREVSVQESTERGFTLRRGGRGHRSARLSLLTIDKRVLNLPKTDAASGAEPIENMANFLRLRLQQLREAELQKAQQNQAVKPLVRQREVSRPLSPAPTVAPLQPLSSAVAPSASALKGTSLPPLMRDAVTPAAPGDEELDRALRQLRHQGAGRGAAGASAEQTAARHKAATRTR